MMGKGGEGEENALRRGRVFGRAVVVIEAKKDCMSMISRAVLGGVMLVAGRIRLFQYRVLSLGVSLVNEIVDGRSRV